jgi:hypothetical protein
MSTVGTHYSNVLRYGCPGSVPYMRWKTASRHGAIRIPKSSYQSRLEEYAYTSNPYANSNDDLDSNYDNKLENNFVNCLGMQLSKSSLGVYAIGIVGGLLAVIWNVRFK